MKILGIILYSRKQIERSLCWSCLVQPVLLPLVLHAVAPGFENVPLVDLYPLLLPFQELHVILCYCLCQILKKCLKKMDHAVAQALSVVLYHYPTQHDPIYAFMYFLIFGMLGIGLVSAKFMGHRPFQNAIVFTLILLISVIAIIRPLLQSTLGQDPFLW